MTHSQTRVAPCRAARCGTPWCVTPSCRSSSSPSFTSKSAVGSPCGAQGQSTGHCWSCTAGTEPCRVSQLGCEELLTQTFPSQLLSSGVGLMGASGWISHHGYWGLFFTINYLFILKRRLERDQASSGTETMEALGKQEPVSQPGCGTVAVPQQGMLVGLGGAAALTCPLLVAKPRAVPAGPWGPARPQGLCDQLHFPPVGAKHNLPLMPRYLWHRDVGRKPTGVSKAWTVSKVRAVFDGGEYALEN